MKRLTELREESSGQTRMLWHSSFWDGPQSGMMLWEGEMAWFSLFDEKHDEVLMPEEDWKEWVDYYKEKYGEEPNEEDRVEYERTRFFKVYRLPVDVKDAIIHNHIRFQKYVGLHTDYDENGRRGRGASSSKDLGDLRPYNMHAKFYNAKSSNSWLVKLFPFLFKKEDTHINYEWDIKKYEVIGEFIDY